MPRKVLDISLIEENKSDLTFFNIDEEEGNETLKALKQSYVTTNYKEETILNLQNTLNSSSDDTSKELKIESYKRYNNSLDLAYKNYITSACEHIETALEINPKDVDILNLKGLLTLLKCDFSKAFESFYTAMCYGNNEMSRKYVDMLSSDDFKVFLARYNHSIRFINEELNDECIHILENIIDEDPDLIEPYVLLSLIYDKLGDIKRKESYLKYLRDVDKDNPLFEEEIKTIESQAQEKAEKVENTNKVKQKHKIPYILIVVLLLGVGSYYVYNKNQIENLNSKLSQKEETLDAVGKQLDKKDEKLKEKEQELDKVKNEEKEKETKVELLVSDEETLYNEAIKMKKEEDYKGAIERFKYVISSGKTKKYISESIYEVALLNQKTGNNEDAIKYYNKYINTYTSKDQYYDDAFYQLGMLYYNTGELKQAQKTFYGLRSEVPDSMYNNSKVDEILKER
ncbi:tetratricopeptide repeat protein [Romboutsia lituseburensis]|uniref:tetratricopeptide repeat protein n=1 Tax=Romboutsia lituseburensis TaxID=1537 RepID=UPI0022EA6DC1|nr:tetratricopeptide repeat protein [Romboutsia lituseburensis]